MDRLPLPTGQFSTVGAVMYGAVGCKIVNLFGVLAFADDIDLLAPTVRAVRYMLKLCDDYANAFSIMFNATKSKCVIVKPPRMCTYTESNFYIGGNRIEIVNRLPHFGDIVDCKCNDSTAIINAFNSLVGQINNVLCRFKSVGAVSKVKLMKAYCSSSCGSVLWNLWHDDIVAVCVGWRIGIGRVLGLPGNAYWDILPVIIVCQ